MLVAAGGEERVRPCFSDRKRSKPCDKIGKRLRGLLPAPLPDREAVLTLPVAEDDRERDLLELGRPDPLADRLVRLRDVDPVTGASKRLADRSRRLEMRLADRQDPHLHGRDPERERAGVVLGEDADEPLERAEERAVDDEDRVL